MLLTTEGQISRCKDFLNNQEKRELLRNKIPSKDEGASCWRKEPWLQRPALQVSCCGPLRPRPVSSAALGPGAGPGFPSWSELQPPFLWRLLSGNLPSESGGLEAEFFFSGCSHTSALNPFRLKLWIGKSRRKTDDSQTGAITMTSQRQPTSWGLQLRRLHKVHGGNNPSCSPCLSFPSPPPQPPLL